MTPRLMTMRFAVASAIALLSASLTTACFCPLWDQGCGGRVETEGVDYIKYTGIVKDAETGKVLPGISGARVTYFFKGSGERFSRDLALQANPDGTFSLLAGTRGLPYRISVTAPGYEVYVIEVVEGQHQFIVMMKPLHESH